MPKGAKRFLILAGILAGMSFWLDLGNATLGQAPPSPAGGREEAIVETRAKGTFDVTLTPQPMGEGLEGEANGRLGRMSIEKQFQGDLEATSLGQMLSAYGNVEGSAGYVAIERVSGKLHQREGTFVLQHSGTMQRGMQELTITVVPDSATGELVGLDGRMSIRIEDGKHFYDFLYTLPDAQTPVPN